MPARWSPSLLLTLALVIGMSQALAEDRTANHPSPGSESTCDEESLEGGSARTGMFSKTLTVQGDRFLLDGRPFRMWGIRTAGATQDDDQCDHLLAQLDDYKAHGVNVVTVFYQGCRGASYDPFSPDGRRVDPGHQRRMERILRACAGRGMVVVVGIFYQHAPFGLRDAEAVREAVRTVATNLKSYRHVILNIANEQNSGGWADTAAVYDFRDPQRIIDLCRLVHEVDPGRLAGGGGYDHGKNRVIGRSPEVDVLLFDTSGPDPGSGELYARFLAGGVTGKPMVNVELFGGWTGRFQRGVFPEEARRAYRREVATTAGRPGLSVFFHSSPWCQEEPMRYDLGGLGTAADPGIRWYFEAVRQEAGSRSGD